MRTLITIIACLATFATLSACCLVLVGCEERISPEEYIELNALADTIVAQHETLKATIQGILNYIPCPPCPDTVIRDIIFGLPPGTWVKTEHFYRKCLLHRKAGVPLEPDSIFIPRKE